MTLPLPLTSQPRSPRPRATSNADDEGGEDGIRSPRKKMVSITSELATKSLNPSHIQHRLNINKRRGIQRNESLNQYYSSHRGGGDRDADGYDEKAAFFAPPVLERDGDEALLEAGGDPGAAEELKGKAEGGEDAEALPSAPRLELSVKDKVGLAIISLVCILVIVCVTAWIGPEMHDFEEKLIHNVHSTHFNENPGFVLSLAGLGASPATEQVQPAVRTITELDSGRVFDVRAILGATTPSQTTTRRRRRRRLASPAEIGRELSSTKSGEVTVDVVYTLSDGTEAKCLADPITHSVYSDRETEFLETINADLIGEGACPQLGSGAAGSTYAFVMMTSSSNPVGTAFEVVSLPGWAKHRVLLSGLLLILVYVFIVLDIIHRTLVAMVGGLIALMLLSAMGEYRNLQEVVIFIDEATLALLFGMMIIVNIMSTTGVFEWIAVRALDKSRGDMRKLLVMLCVATAVLSAFLDNVTTMLLLAPVTIEMCSLIGVPPIPFLISEVMFSNVGGTATMIGDPPNIIIGSLLEQHVDFVDFIINLMPIIIIACVPLTFFMLWYYRREVGGEPREFSIDLLKKQYPITNPLLLVQSGIIMFTVMLLFFLEPVHHISTSWIAILGAIGMMLIATPHDLHHVFETVEWDTLLFFAALFVMIEAMAEMGLIRWIGDRLTDIIDSAAPDQQLTVAIIVIIWASAIVSGFLDNIPYTTTMVPVIKQLSENPNIPLTALIWSLSLGACLGGNMTLVGASANLVTAGTAEHVGHKIGFLQFMKVGAPVVFITVTLGMTWCLVMYDVVGWNTTDTDGGLR